MRGPGERGVTLVELLIAIPVLAMAILGIAGMFPSAYRNVMQGGRISKATALAQQKMEELKNRASANLPVSEHEVADAANRIEDFYTRTWRIEDRSLGAGIPVGMKRITVTVAWPGPGSPIQLSTLVAP